MIGRLLRMFWRKADIAIGGWDDPYLLRWYILPRNRWFNLYLHKFCRDDDDRALHDHPWWFLSLILSGQYWEHFEKVLLGVPVVKTTHRRAGSFAYRPATHKHRVELGKAPGGASLPCWTLVVTGARSREWGFWCPQGFVHWTDFTSGEQGETVGRGCGEH